MEPTHSTHRIAFSFAHGTFDIERMRSELWHADDDSGSAFVQLDAGWSRLLPALGGIGWLMACAPSHPITAAVALKSVKFEHVPDSADWICLESGMEICPETWAECSRHWSRWKRAGDSGAAIL